MATDGHPRLRAVSVRACAASDWAQVRDVRLAALLDAPGMFGSNLERERAFDQATWRARTARTVLAWRDELAVGIAGYGWHEPGLSADLVSMWVAPAARGGGAGDALVQWVIGAVVQARGAALELGVVSDNVAAVQLYRRHGFVDIGTTVGLYSGSTLLRMRYAPG